jgi:xanthine dehydrogenase accessory factor
MAQASTTIEYVAPRRAVVTDLDVDILSFASHHFAQGAGVALCTLVEIRGGSSKALGAHMAVRADGLYCGYVSGGCTEPAIAAEAVEAIAKGADRFVMIGEGSPFFDIVLPCGGGITVAVHVIRDRGPIDAVLAEVEERHSAGFCYSPGRQSLCVQQIQGKVGWRDDMFMTSYRPRARLLISGRSIEMYATAKVGEAAGYDVICHDPSIRKGIDEDSIDEYTAVALLHHDLDVEIPILRAALERSPFYVGALGSSRTHEKRVSRLLQLGVSATAIARVKAPIGLIGKVRDAHTLALSVLADVAVEWQDLGAKGVSEPD